MRTLALWLTTALLGTACSSGNVTAPNGLDRFGGLSSATWLVITSTDDGDVDVDHSIVLTTTNGFCGKAQKAYSQFAEILEAIQDERQQIYEDLETNYEDQEYEDVLTARNRRYCELYRDYYGQLGSATRPIQNNGTNTVSITTRRSVDGETVNTPASGTYKTSDISDSEDDSLWSGSLSYSKGNYYLAVEKALKDKGCDNLGDEYDALYEVLEEAQDESPDELPIRKGTLTLEAKGDAKFKFEITEANVDEAEGLTAKGTLKRCDVSIEGYAYID